MWPQILPLLGGLLDKLLPDPQAAADAKLKMLDLAQKGELAQLDADVRLATGQVEVNKTEAASASLFVSGWRPFVGWTCGLAFFFKFAGGPLLFMVAQAFGRHIELPQVDYSELWPVLIGMLGLGAYRSYEKVKGVS